MVLGDQNSLHVALPRAGEVRVLGCNTLVKLILNPMLPIACGLGSSEPFFQRRLGGFSLFTLVKSRQEDQDSCL